MKTFLDELLAYKELLLELVKRDLRVKYRKSVLGYLWSLLNPLMMMMVVSIVFSYMFRFDIENYPVYLITGQTLFNFFQEATNMSMNSITNSASLIKKFCNLFIFFDGNCDHYDFYEGKGYTGYFAGAASTPVYLSVLHGCWTDFVYYGNLFQRCVLLMGNFHYSLDVFYPYLLSGNPAPGLCHEHYEVIWNIPNLEASCGLHFLCAAGIECGNSGVQKETGRSDLIFIICGRNIRESGCDKGQQCDNAL